MFKTTTALVLLSATVQARFADVPSNRNDQSYYKDNTGRMHLKADANNKFRIMQLTDLHLGESLERDQKTMDMI